MIAAGLAIALIVATEVVAGGDPEFLAAIYSFGVLIAFTAAQLAVIRLRGASRRSCARSGRGRTSPFAASTCLSRRSSARPSRQPSGCSRSSRTPAPATSAALAADRARGLRRRSPDRAARPAGGRLDGRASPGRGFKRILVPMKLGDIGEEMVATAIALARESGAEIEAITVVRVPRRYQLEGASRPRWLLGSTPRSRRRGCSGRSRCGGADGRGSGAIDRPRDRRRGEVAGCGSRRARLRGSLEASSRFFSPTVDFVLRRAAAKFS